MTGGHWIALDSHQYLNNLLSYVKHDERLDVLIRRIFTETLAKMMRYANCTHGVHIMSNAVLKESGAIDAIECDHLYVDPTLRPYLAKALLQRQPGSTTPTDYTGLPLYTRKKVAESLRAKGLRNDLLDMLSRHSPCFPETYPRDQWDGIIKFLNEAGAGLADTRGHTAPIDCKSNELMVIPLSTPNLKFPAGILGTFLMWKNQNEDRVSHARGERLIEPAKNLSVFIHRLFEAHYGMTESTYLPSYQKPEEKSVAIMFADIRDFTPTTEICRNTGRLTDWTDFMRDHCRTMCEIIQKHRGRVHGLAGDGIMALFGEYGTGHQDAVRAAVAAAKEMCARFDRLKQEFLGSERIREFMQHNYEPMEFRLGIGINYGLVIFDYFGAPGSRVYSPLGDHVNFAQRLESQANRFDDTRGRWRTPILLSRPAWLAAGYGDEGIASVLSLHFKGKPYEYPAYEISPV